VHSDPGNMVQLGREAVTMNNDEVGRAYLAADRTPGHNAANLVAKECERRRVYQ